jgi:hypothetical protein
MTAPDRVDRMLAFLEEHRAEVEALPSGAVRFAFHGDELRVVVERTQKLPAARQPAALVR